MPVSIVHSARRAGAIGIACAAVSAAIGAPARADVIEVHADGSTITYTGPVISTADGIRPVRETITMPPVRVTAAPQALSGAISAASKKYRISGRLIEAVAWQESRFNPHAVSPKGARGVMQLMPGTARELGVDPGEPSQNIEGGAAYLSLLMRRFDGDLLQALSAYNAGPGAIARYGGEPPYAETQKFVDAVFDRLATMSADTEAPLEAEP